MPARSDDPGTTHVVALVEELLVSVAYALASDAPIPQEQVRHIAGLIVRSTSARAFSVAARSWAPGIDGGATHATNVAIMTAAIAATAGFPEATQVEITAAAILHDAGQLLLPNEIRGVPEPLLDHNSRQMFQAHPLAGALALLGSGSPPLWAAVSLEHHRGIDGGGYPALDSKAAPHELVRIVALASYVDRKRTLLHGRRVDPDDALLGAMALEDRYFGRPLLRWYFRALGAHAPGTTVELSDGEPAIVTSVDGVDPLRPDVRLLRGPKAGKTVRLSEIDPELGRYALSIVRAVPPPLFVLSDVPGADPAKSAQAAVSSRRRPAPAPAPEPAAPDPRVEEIELLMMMGEWAEALRASEALVLAEPKHRSARVLAARCADELARASNPPAAPATGAISLDRVPFAVDPTGAAPPGLDRRRGLVLACVDGTSSVGEIVSNSGMPRADVIKILGELMERGAIGLK